MSNAYIDQYTHEWIGEHKTREQGGTVRRRTEWFDTKDEAQAFSRTGHTDAQRTRDHIRFKVSCRELDPAIGEEMLRLSAEEPELDYRVLFQRAIYRALPDTAFHVSPMKNRASILTHGLEQRDPHAGPYAYWVPPSQPAAVYVSDLEEALTGRFSHGDVGENDIWRIDGLHAFDPEWVQDQLNPTCWAVLTSIPTHLVTLYSSPMSRP